MIAGKKIGQKKHVNCVELKKKAAKIKKKGREYAKLFWGNNLKTCFGTGWKGPSNKLLAEWMETKIMKLFKMKLKWGDAKRGFSRFVKEWEWFIRAE